MSVQMAGDYKGSFITAMFQQASALGWDNGRIGEYR